MAILNANDSKENSIKNTPQKPLQQLRIEIGEAIKLCTDSGYFNVGFIIPKTTSEQDQEAILSELNDKKYSLDTHQSPEGLHLNIKWDRPLP